MFFFDKQKECPVNTDPLISRLWTVVRISVRVMAVLMTLVIIWGIFDVGYVLYQRMTTPPMFLLEINDILATFGAFMAVLIAIEIFANIIIYLEYKMIHLKLVLSTALMAAARKIIVLDFKVNTYEEALALGAVILALGVCYWLVCMRESCGDSSDQPFIHAPEAATPGEGCVRPEADESNRS